MNELTKNAKRNIYLKYLFKDFGIIKIQKHRHKRALPNTTKEPE